MEVPKMAPKKTRAKQIEAELVFQMPNAKLSNRQAWKTIVQNFRDPVAPTALDKSRPNVC